MDFVLAHIDLVDHSRALWHNATIVFWAMLLGHALADFPLQGQFLAVGKDRHADLSAITGGKLWPRGMWLYCLSIHSLIHAAAIWIISGSVLLSMIEFAFHWIIDLAKNERITSFYGDQFLHIACKAAYAAPLCLGWFSW